MVDASRLLDAAGRAGFGLFTGVPCSYLTPLIDRLSESTGGPGGPGSPEGPGARYLPAANEGEAVAIACGAELGGLPGVVFFQNSGLGNAVNPLTSLAQTFDIPFLLLVTWRGDPERAPDEPQHRLMGAITPTLLEAMEIPWERLPEDEAGLEQALARAATHMRERRRPYALVAAKGCVSGEPATGSTAGRATHANREAGSRSATDSNGATGPGSPAGEPLDPDACLEALASRTEDDAVLTTTGFTGRALYAVGDRANQLYMVGSMGCVSSLGLGLAVARPERRVVVVDGDGAFLMRMGALAAVGRERPANLVHVLLDNGVHDSTGAQPSLASVVDPVGVALASGYVAARRLDSPAELAAALEDEAPGPRLLHLRTLPRRDRKLPRPTIQPREVAERLRVWLRG